IDGFYADAFGILTPEQVEEVSPEKLRYRIQVDMLSSGWGWATLAFPLHCENVEHLVNVVTSGLSSQFNVMPRIEEMRKIVAAWAVDVPYEPLDYIEARGFLKIARVKEAARRMVGLLRGIMDGMKLPKATVDEARLIPNPYVPVLRSR